MLFTKFLFSLNSFNPDFIDATLGLAKCRELSNLFSQALDILSQQLLKTPSSIGIIIEKMKLQLTSLDWDLFNSGAAEAISINTECLEAKRYQILKLLCSDGQYNRVRTIY